MKRLLLLVLAFYSLDLNAQNTNETFNIAYTKFAADSAFNHALISLYVVNSDSNKPVTEVNINTGVAPASCQKVITSVTAYELLGHDYSFTTTLAYTGKIENGILNGDIIIKGNGDPTLGSWRYKSTTEDNVIAAFKAAIARQGIKKLNGNVYADESLFTDEATPDGWIWQDIGSYYGAGARAVNWRENQYDLYLKSGKNIGDSVQVVATKPEYIYGLNLKSLATSAKKGSGDNTYIYYPLNDPFNNIRGTIPVNEDRFTVSGSIPHPATQIALTLEAALKDLPIQSVAQNYPSSIKNIQSAQVFYTYTSPPLDSIIYYFLKRSINLYGEALIKTLGNQVSKRGSTGAGVEVIKNFWEKKGIEPSAMNVMDGSGLSPANRITTKTLVTVMDYAKRQSWFPSFFNGLPEISGIKMKSGTINGVLSYTGYIKGKNGNNYIFAFVINNYNGTAQDIRKKMWKLLGEL